MPEGTIDGVARFDAAGEGRTEPECPLWSPSLERKADQPVSHFADLVRSRHRLDFADYADLHAWSIAAPGLFWQAVWDFCSVVGNPGPIPFEPGVDMIADRFFPAARLNFAETILRHRGDVDADADAIVFRSEDGSSRRLSWNDLRDRVSKMQQWLRSVGIVPGDRVAAILPNMPETVVAMLATASVGATWSSCSPDFSERALLDRLAQIDPVVLLVVDGYRYGGKTILLGERMATVSAALATVRQTLVVDMLGMVDHVAHRIPGAKSLADALGGFAPAPMRFEPLPFAHPLLILFSSGTTAAPKCIVHSAGGTLLQHLKEQQLHCSLQAGDRLFFFSTCGWMMWNWLVSGLASGATLLLYDGAPTYPSADALFAYASDERATHFGTSPRYLDLVRRAGSRPSLDHDLTALRTVLSTGSPLTAEGFRFVYHEIGPDVHLASIAGGTDIMGCFVLGVPVEPVWPGEIQGPGLGMAVEIWDEDAHPVERGRGELVCTRSFPSMPLGFLNDGDGSKYHDAYFARFAGVWCHGDFAEWTAHGGMVIHGRSDATLNPGGVRIGTAEIYAQLEDMTQVVDAVCIGQEWHGDTRIVLFVQLARGQALDTALETQIRTRIRTGASPRHVPSRILAVQDVPRTSSGKVTELAVRDAVHGKPVMNRDAIANPEALDHYRDRQELAA